MPRKWLLQRSAHQCCQWEIVKKVSEYLPDISVSIPVSESEESNVATSLVENRGIVLFQKKKKTESRGILP